MGNTILFQCTSCQAKCCHSLSCAEATAVHQMTFLTWKSLRVNFYTWSITETKYHNPRKGSQKYRVKYQTHLLTTQLIVTEFNVLCYRKDTNTNTGIRSYNMFYFYIYWLRDSNYWSKYPFYIRWPEDICAWNQIMYSWFL